MSVVPDSWEMALLGDLCRIELGSTPARGNVRLWDTDKSTENVWLSISDMLNSKDAVVFDSREYVSDAAAKQMRLIPTGTLLVSFKLTLGRLCYAGRDLYTNEAIAALLDLDHTRLSKEYLYWYLTFFDWDAASEGDEKVKGKTLNKAKLRVLPIVIPPPDEQKRIVAVLDQAFAALDRARVNAEANLADAEKLFASELDDMFARKGGDWTRRMLSSVGTLMTGSTPKTSEPENFGDEVPFITPGDFRADGSLDTHNRGLSKQGASKARLIPSGSALMVCIGATIGKAGFTTGEIATNQQINAISPHKDVSGEFLYFQFLTPRFQKAVIKRAGQATLPIISKGKWGELEVHMPPSLGMQVDVVMKMREVRIHTAQLQISYNAKLADITALRQSLLQAAFSGQLT